MEILSQISLGAAALLIFAVCAIYMLIRGLLRTIVNLSMIGASLWIGFLTWQKAPSLALQWTNQTSPIITTGLPIVAFLVSFILIRKILKFFFVPISTQADDDDDNPRESRSLAGKLCITFIFATALCLITAAVLHHITSVAEIREHAKHQGSKNESLSFAARTRQALASSIPSSIMDRLDPLATQSRVKLAKMIAAGSDESAKPEIDPATGKPIPRAAIVDNPELKSLAEKGRFSTLLRHPLLSEALKDPLVKKSLGID